LPDKLAEHEKAKTHFIQPPRANRRLAISSNARMTFPFFPFLYRKEIGFPIAARRIYTSAKIVLDRNRAFDISRFYLDLTRGGLLGIDEVG